MSTISDLTHFLEDFAPRRLAADWDNVGLLLGDTAAGVERVMTCLTLTADVADEAVARRADLIVSHHPILFRATQRITSANAEGRLLLKLLTANIAVYSPHTAFDNTKGGINDGLARRLGLHAVEPLRPIAGIKQCKIVVFVPDADLGKVSDALFAAGAGQIGQYSQCSYRLLGTGTFFGSDATNPTIGEKGRREEAQEWRLEAICPEAKVDEAIRAMRGAHSYEEPAYDVYILRPDSHAGMGRIGTLLTPMALGELAEKVAETLKADTVQMVGVRTRMAQRVALACGAAGEFVHDALRLKADVFLTGEMRFHDCLAARDGNLAVLLPGHFATERPGVEDLAQLLQQQFPHLEVWASSVERDPLSS